MKFLSICSGIDAPSVAWKDLGWKPAAYAEINKFASQILHFHHQRQYKCDDANYPENIGDILTFRGFKKYRGVEILVGGTPCQPFSNAGDKKGGDDPRADLTFRFAQIANIVNPRYIVWENVDAVLHKKFAVFFGNFIRRLCGSKEPVRPIGESWPTAGYVRGKKRIVAWRVLDSKYFGTAQRRKRVYIIACPLGGPDPREILFEYTDVEYVIREINYAIDSGDGEKEEKPRENTGDRENTEAYKRPIAFTGDSTNKIGEELCFTFRATPFNFGAAVLYFSATEKKDILRRMYPEEIEKIQGFPENYTSPPTVKACHTNRIRVLGNAMTVPVMRWLGERIDSVDRQWKADTKYTETPRRGRPPIGEVKLSNKEYKRRQRLKKLPDSYFESLSSRLDKRGRRTKSIFGIAMPAAKRQKLYRQRKKAAEEAARIAAEEAAAVAAEIVDHVPPNGKQ